MNKLLKHAFTLIELLVVIAIIGILSGLIVVAMSGVTEKANIAKSQVFSNSLKNSLMLNLVSEWRLDNNLNDSWNGGNNGTWTGPLAPNLSINYRPEAECVSGQCLNFDGADDRVSIINNANLNLGSKITIEAWIKPTRLDVNYQGIVVKGAQGYGYHFMTGSGSALASIFPHMRTNGAWQSTCASPTLTLNKWNFVVWTYDSTVSGVNTRCYTNTSYTTYTGVGQITYEVDDNLYIGYSKYGSQFFNGSIDQIRIYSESMLTSEVINHYYIGLNKLLANGGITKKEYRERLGELSIADK